MEREMIDSVNSLVKILGMSRYSGFQKDLTHYLLGDITEDQFDRKARRFLSAVSPCLLMKRYNSMIVRCIKDSKPVLDKNWRIAPPSTQCRSAK